MNNIKFQSLCSSSLRNTTFWKSRSGEKDQISSHVISFTPKIRVHTWWLQHSFADKCTSLFLWCFRGIHRAKLPNSNQSTVCFFCWCNWGARRCWRSPLSFGNYYKVMATTVHSNSPLCVSPVHFLPHSPHGLLQLLSAHIPLHLLPRTLSRYPCALFHQENKSPSLTLPHPPESP